MENGTVPKNGFLLVMALLVAVGLWFNLDVIRIAFDGYPGKPGFGHLFVKIKSMKTKVFQLGAVLGSLGIWCFEKFAAYWMLAFNVG